MSDRWFPILDKGVSMLSTGVPICGTARGFLYITYRACYIREVSLCQAGALHV